MHEILILDITIKAIFNTWTKVTLSRFRCHSITFCVETAHIFRPRSLHKRCALFGIEQNQPWSPSNTIHHNLTSPATTYHHPTSPIIPYHHPSLHTTIHRYPSPPFVSHHHSPALITHFQLYSIATEVSAFTLPFGFRWLLIYMRAELNGLCWKYLHVY